MGHPAVTPFQMSAYPLNWDNKARLLVIERAACSMPLHLIVLALLKKSMSLASRILFFTSIQLEY